MALTKVNNRMIDGASVNVMDFGAKGDGVTDDTSAIQAAIDYAEQSGRAGGTVYVPEGSYKCTNKIRLGGWVTLKGSGRFSSSLFWDSSYTNGHCIELGPDESGSFNYSNSYTFGSRIENLDLNAGNVYRGSNKAVVYTVGAHQYSGLFNTTVRGFSSYGVHNDLATGGQASFILENVEIQGGTLSPSSGNHFGLVCSGAGAFIKADNLIVQGTAGLPLEQGVRMLKDNLVLNGGHVEYCTVGVALLQNESTIRTNSITGLTGHSSVSDLILSGTTTNLAYNILSTSNLTITSTTINVLRDTKSGVTIGGAGGKSIGSYSSSARQGGNNVVFAWGHYNVGAGGLGQKHKISSVTSSSTGVYVFNLSEPLSNTAACPIPSVRFSSAALGTGVATVTSTTSVEVKCYNSSGTLAAPTYIYLALFGEN